MALAAYASVLSLMRSLDNALLPPRCRLLPNKSRVETLQEKLGSLQESLERHASNRANKELLLDDPTIKRIREVVYEADNVIDKYVVDRLHGAESEDECDIMILSSSFCRDIEGSIQGIESINQELQMMMAKDHIKVVQQSINSSPGGASRVDSAHGKDTMVGFNDHLEKILDRLDRPEPNLKIIPIVGMGGIGKTTLARHTFDSRFITDKFDVRIWLTISQECDVPEILQGLERDGIIEKSAQDLGTCLYQKLRGRRYLIVMDDLWSIQVWDDLKTFFPNDGNKSRIVITTRLSNVADSLAPNKGYSIGLLDEENSWTLFREKSFCNGGWSDELEVIGKKIVKKCGGLPLTLVVIGGLLAKSNGDREYWELVAENMISFINSEIDEKNCLRILSLSYNHLPIHLKACFLYVGVLPEDNDIKVSLLIKLWVADGIVKPDRDRNMEDIAREYLEDLVGRNMIFVRQLGNLKKIKSCGIHDLLRQLCISELRKEGFLSVPTVQEIPFFNRNFENSCFLCCKNRAYERIQLPQVLVGSRSTTLVTSLVCDECDVRYTRLNESRSVKVVKYLHNRLVEIPQLTKVRFLSINNDMFGFAYPPTLSLLWNLQVLYSKIRIPQFEMSKIWEMPQLRHFRLWQELPDPECADGIVVLKHLQTISKVINLRFTNDLVGRIPNLVKLRVFYDIYSSGENNISYYCLDNLALLHNLRSLLVECNGFSLDIRSISFPCSLKKLTLSECKLHWEDMATIGSLPNLEVLKLCSNAFVGNEWCTVEGNFPKLRYLEMNNLDLVIWRADSSHFPVLEDLVLIFLFRLEEFPLDVGDINTLRTIFVTLVSHCIVNSVKQIRKEQKDCGNELLCIEIVGYIETEVDSEIQLEEEDED